MHTEQKGSVYVLEAVREMGEQGDEGAGDGGERGYDRCSDAILAVSTVLRASKQVTYPILKNWWLGRVHAGEFLVVVKGR